MRRLKKVVAVGFIALSAQTATSPLVHAAYTKDDTFYNNNNVFFYDPSYSNTACSTSDTSTDTSDNSSTVNLQPSDKLKTIFQDLLDGGMTAVQAAAVMGNMDGESGFNPAQEEIGGGGGYGLAQWTNTTGSPRRDALFAYAAAQNESVSTVALQMKFLLKEYNDSFKASLANTAFGTGTNIDDATTAWMKIFENPAQVGSDPAHINTVRIPAAHQIYGFYSNLAPGTADATATATASGCGSDGTNSGSAVAGNIVATAMNYAWPYEVPEGTVNKSDATSAYQDAKEQFNPGNPPSYSDCGGFIATVMRASGVDTQYTSFSVAAQTDYVEKHPEKYKVILNPTMSDLQPGDILLSNEAGHTSMYIGPHTIKGKLYTVAQASLNEEVPNLRYSGSEAWMISHGAIIARFVGSN